MRAAFVATITAIAVVVALASSATAATTKPDSRFARSGEASDDASPSHSYAYERGYARFVDGGEGKGIDDEKQRKKLEFVRVEPDDDFSSSRPASPSPWTPPREAVAWVEYVDASATASGTGHLHVATDGRFPDLEQWRAAGFVEGFTTASRIADHLLNTRDYFVDPVRGLNASLDGGPLSWLEEQDEWLRGAVEEKLRGVGGGGGGEGVEEKLRGDVDVDDDGATEGDDEEPLDYWRAAAGTLAQLDGLAEGYRAAREASVGAAAAASGSHPSTSSSSTPSSSPLPDLSYEDLRFLNGNGELYDVIEHFKNKERGGAERKAKGTGRVRAAFDASPSGGGDGDDGERLYRALALSGRCSSLVAVTPDLSDLLIGHATWDSYSQANKIFKYYSLALNDVGGGGRGLASRDGRGRPRRERRPRKGEQQRLAMSSFPGELFSDDDFYLTPRLSVVSTTNHILNPDLFEDLPSRGVLLSWQRVRIALLLSSDGESWAETFSRRNSGTYNNQYDVVTLSRFSPGTELRPGLLWVVEQIPGLVVAADQTATLERGSWPAYTVPFYPEVARRSGISSFVGGGLESGKLKKAVRWLSYQLAPRAMLFRRGSNSLTSASDLRALMRSNTYSTGDPLTGGDPVAAICGRGDLEDGTASPRMASGCFDGKVTSFARALRLEADAVAGPTTAGGTLKPFSWRDDPEFEKVPHRGLPETFDFDFEAFRPRLEARAKGEGGGGVSSE